MSRDGVGGVTSIEQIPLSAAANAGMGSCGWAGECEGASEWEDGCALVMWCYLDL